MPNFVMIKRMMAAGFTAMAMLASYAVSAQEEQAAKPETAPAAKPAIETKTAKLADWITVTYPVFSKSEGEIEIKVKLNGIQEGYVLSADMHYFCGPKYGGFLCWQAPITVEAGKDEYTLTYKISKKEGITAAGIVFYVGPTKGWKERKKDVWLRYIRIKE